MEQVQQLSAKLIHNSRQTHVTEKKLHFAINIWHLKQYKGAERFQAPSLSAYRQNSKLEDQQIHEDIHYFTVPNNAHFIHFNLLAPEFYI
jgi:hypothetical protein